MIFPRLVSLTSPRWLTALLAAAAVFAPAASARTRASHPAETGATYKGAITIDAATGNVLFEDHSDEFSPPASMTKLMTFAVLSDKLRSGALTLQTNVTVNAADSHIGGTRVWLKEKEVFSVEELIYAMMIQSANDAAYALAHNAAGSVPAFVELMNAKARELGMTHTTFRTPHGLPPSNRRVADGDISTPHDYALLCRYLVLNTDVIKYTSVKRRAFGPPARGTIMDNHDHLLARVEGVDGLKTGFTNGAGFCLSATALRNNHRIIVVVMGSPDAKSRDIKVADLLERGFAALPPGSPAFVAAASSTPAVPVNEASPISAAPLPAGPSGNSSDAGPVIKLSTPTERKSQK